MAYLRALLYRLHVVLGLVGGLFFSVLGLTGAALAFRPEMERAMYWPKTGAVTVAAANWEQAAALVLKQSAIPGRRIREVNLRPGYAWEFVVHNRDGSDIASYYVDPGNGRILSSRQHEESAFHTLHRLHADLMSGRHGTLIVSRLALLLLLQILGGWVLWFLRGRPLHAHTLTGLSLGVLIALAAYTGFRMLTTRAVSITPVVTLRGVENKTTLDKIVETAMKRRTGMELASIEFPQAPAQPYQFWFRERPLDTVVYMDPYGAVLPMMIRPEGNTARDWHSGPAGGTFAAILRFIAGLAIPVLSGTGAWRQWREYQARQSMGAGGNP